MKTSRVVLADWVSTDLYTDIDWPEVHKKLGLEQLDWLLSLPSDQCQLVLDKYEVNNKLVAEFYDEKTLLAYHLMWPKI
jgi:hypothetical protein